MEVSKRILYTRDVILSSQMQDAEDVSGLYFSISNGVVDPHLN